jgi:hypothetical protein
VPIREQSRSGNCLSRLPFCGRRRPRCFASAATTHRVESSSARSAPLPSIAFRSLPKLSSGEPRGPARREARWRSRGYIQVGMRGNAVGSCRRRHWPRRGPARESERTKVCHAPLRRGALRGETDPGRCASHDFFKGSARALSRPFSTPAGATTTVARREGPVVGPKRARTRLALRGRA